MDTSYYLSHRSAAEHWGIPRLDLVVRDRVETPPLVDVAFYGAGSRFDLKGRKVHCSRLPLPPGSVLERGGLKVASPELVFLQMGETLDTLALVLLGLQMCGHPVGVPAEAISSKQKLEAFVGAAQGRRGHRNAAQALRYVADGSASVMESLLYMTLTLPSLWGGYGLGGAEFNRAILLGTEGVKRLGNARCYADLYYEKENLAVEYQSFAHHGTPVAQGWDMARAAALELQGIEVMQLSTYQFYDAEHTRVFAHNLAKRLGRRPPARSKRFDAMHGRLRQLFPQAPPAT
jgi:hypothetical protein